MQAIKLPTLITAGLIGIPLLTSSPVAQGADDPEKASLKTEMEELKARLGALEKKLEEKEKVEKAAPPAEAAAPPAAKLTPPAWPVLGIYTVPDTKDLGQLTGRRND
ncbi:MAG: hypothetical protein ACT4NU_13255 [Chromatiales bacterium]